jgi:hypothetical protein
MLKMDLRSEVGAHPGIWIHYLNDELHHSFVGQVEDIVAFALMLDILRCNFLAFKIWN